MGASTILPFHGDTPYTIAAGTTFVAPRNAQTLFSLVINCDGVLDLAGLLVEVQ